ncbi:MAG: hypothetical protein JO234_16475, partial [Hyphomicrobiales bacterium]|nr:hypothetical protein [Hyphomicrobiales bacterium]
MADADLLDPAAPTQAAITPAVLPPPPPPYPRPAGVTVDTSFLDRYQPYDGPAGSQSQFGWLGEGAAALGAAALSTAKDAVTNPVGLTNEAASDNPDAALGEAASDAWRPPYAAPPPAPASSTAAPNPSTEGPNPSTQAPPPDLAGAIAKQPAAQAGVALAEGLTHPEQFFTPYFDAAAQAAADHTGFGRANALADATDKRLADIKAATGVDLPNPNTGGFEDEATQILMDRYRQAGGSLSEPALMLNDPYKFGAERGAIQYELLQKALDNLAAKHQSGSPEDQRALQAINAGQSMEDYTLAFTKATDTQAQALAAKANKALLPWLATMAGGFGGSYRDPVNMLGLVAGVPESQAVSAVGRIVENGFRQGAFNMGLTGIQEPAIQDWNKELGYDNGLLPALDDLGTSALYGMIPGFGIQAIKEIGRVFGPSAPAAIEDFLKQAQETWNARPQTAAGRAHMADIDAWEREKGVEPGSTYGDAGLKYGNKPPPEAPAPAAAAPPEPAPKPAPPAAPTGEAATAPGEPPRLARPLWEGTPYREVSQEVDNLPRTTAATPTAIESAELDHFASPPRLPGVEPTEMASAYQGHVLHGESPDLIAPPTPPLYAPPVHEATTIPASSAPASTGGSAATLDGRPILQNVLFDPRHLGTDAEAMQYKGGSDANGVTDRMQGVQKWDDLASGKVIVYERADGSRVIADGHQRLGLAKRLLAEGHEDNIRLTGTLFKQSDGWTPQDVRAIAAKKNIQEGTGEALDIARVLRDRPDLWDAALPTSMTKVKQAKGLAELADPAWGMMLNGVVPQNYASLVGLNVPNKALHEGIIADMAAAKPANENEARMVIADGQAAGYRQEVQEDMFGATERTVSLRKERAQVYGAVVKLLKEDKKIFGMLDRNAAKIESVGNQLVDTNADQADRAAQLAQIIIKIAERQGPLSAALNRAANGVAEGRPVAKAARDFLDNIDQALTAEGLKTESLTRPSAINLDTPQGRLQQTQALKADAMAAPPAPPLPQPKSIFEDIRDQLLAVGTAPAVADAQAAVWQARYETRATRLGLPPEAGAELYRKAGWRIGAEAPDAELGEQTFNQPAMVPTFYSQVERAVNSAKQAKASPAQWLAMVKNTPGVKPEEMQWLGLEDWLKEQNGPLTR